MTTATEYEMRDVLREELISRFQSMLSDYDDFTTPAALESVLYRLEGPKPFTDEDRTHIVQEILDSCTMDHWHARGPLRRAWQECLISWGGVREVTPAELAAVQLAGGRAFWFEFKCKKYA